MLENKDISDSEHRKGGCCEVHSPGITEWKKQHKNNYIGVFNSMIVNKFITRIKLMNALEYKKMYLIIFLLMLDIIMLRDVILVHEYNTFWFVLGTTGNVIIVLFAVHWILDFK